MNFSFKSRSAAIQKLATDDYDLVIIGGGISGAGVAREAASRGMKVALIEASDFASGTSSRSSKLIHGGIRYLENFEFGLVHEALSERKILFEIAPHLVHPLRFLLPVYKDTRVGMFKLGLGMWLYDMLSTFDAPKMHERLNRAQTMGRAGILNDRDLVGSFEYSDAYMDDDRLVIETLRSAVQYGATCVNYMRAEGAEFESGQVVAIRARETNRDSGEIKISGRHFVSTVGPWTDAIGHKLFSAWRDIMRPSKGVHLIFARERVPLAQAVVMISDDQKRIVFAIPRKDVLIIGTTDTDFKQDPSQVHTDAQDVEYLLQIANDYFPGARLTKDDIVSSYAGVRPLVEDGSPSESKTSREHRIISDDRNVTFLTGGKYTTYRLMAEETVDRVLENFPTEDRVRWGRGRTLEPLNPFATVDHISIAYSRASLWAQEFGIDVDIVHMLIDRHGFEALIILQKWREIAGTGYEAYLRLEALQAIHQTMCLNLRDFYLRRMSLFNNRRDHGYEFLEVLSKVFKNELSWTDDQRLQEINAVRQHQQFELGWR